MNNNKTNNGETRTTADALDETREVIVEHMPPQDPTIALYAQMQQMEEIIARFNNGK